MKEKQSALPANIPIIILACNPIYKQHNVEDASPSIAHKCKSCAITVGHDVSHLTKCGLPDVSALMKLKTEKGLDSDWAQTLTNTLDRWFLPRVPLEDS